MLTPPPPPQWGPTYFHEVLRVPLAEVGPSSHRFSAAHFRCLSVPFSLPYIGRVVLLPLARSPRLHCVFYRLGMTLRCLSTASFSARTRCDTLPHCLSASVSLVGHCLYPVFPLPSLLRHCICRVFRLHSLLRHRIYLASPLPSLPSLLRHRLLLAFPLPALSLLLRFHCL